MIRPVGNEGFVFLAATPDETYTVVRLDQNRNRMWETPLNEHGEATDITVQTDAEGALIGFAITGHKGLNGGGIDGSVTIWMPRERYSGQPSWEIRWEGPVNSRASVQGTQNSFMMNAGAYKARHREGSSSLAAQELRVWTHRCGQRAT